MPDMSVPQKVYLGGKTFWTAGPVRVTNISVAPNPVVTGDTDKQGTTQVMSQFAQSNYIGGSGRYRGNNRTDSGRCWTSELDDAYLDLLTLPPKSIFVGRPSGVTSVCDLTFSFRGVQYFVFSNILYSLSSDLSAFTDVMGGSFPTFPAVPTDAIVYKNTLFIAAGTETHIFTDVLVHTVSTQDSKYLTLWDNKLWAIHQTTNGWVIVQTADGTTWTPGALIPYDADVTDLCTFRDTGGSSVITAITRNGLYLYDANTPRWYLSEVQWPPLQDGDEAKSAMFRDGKLYVNIGNISMVSIQPGNPFTITPMGLDQDDGVPSDETGRINALVADTNFVVAKIDSTTPDAIDDEWIGSDPWEMEDWTTFTGRSTIRRWFGGWHKLYVSGAQSPPGKALDLSSSYAERRLWFSMADGIYYIDMSDSTYNPRMNPTRDYAEGPLGLVTPWWPYLAEGQDKLHGHIYIDAIYASFTETIDVYYQVDFDEGSWIHLATIENPGLHEIIPDKQGVPGQWFRYRFVMDKDAGNLYAPQMRFYRTDTLRLLPATYGYGVNLDLTRPCDGRSPFQQLEDLKNLADPAVTPQLQQFMYRDDAGQDQELYGRVSNMSGTEFPGVELRGQGEWFVSITVPYRDWNNGSLRNTEVHIA
jgi:hypothetical protein